MIRAANWVSYVYDPVGALACRTTMTMEHRDFHFNHRDAGPDAGPTDYQPARPVKPASLTDATSNHL